MYLADDFSKRVWSGENPDDEVSAGSTAEEAPPEEKDANEIVGTPVKEPAAAAATIVRRAIKPRAAAAAAAAAEPAPAEAAPHARPQSPPHAAAAPATAAVTHVAPHTRTTPKSQKELVAALLELQRELGAMDLQAYYETASNITDSKYREPFKQATDLLSVVRVISQT
jgi:hypothetical protein